MAYTYFLSLSHHGLYGTYYQNASCQGTPYKARVLDRTISDQSLTFDILAKNASQFCVEWQGFINMPRKGDWKFFTRSDDASWLWIDEQIVVDNGGMHTAKDARGEISLEKGWHRIRIRYTEMGGESRFKVSWEPQNDIIIPLTSEILYPPTLMNTLWYKVLQANKLLALISISSCLFLICFPLGYYVICRPSYSWKSLWMVESLLFLIVVLLHISTIIDTVEQLRIAGVNVIENSAQFYINLTTPHAGTDILPREVQEIDAMSRAFPDIRAYQISAQLKKDTLIGQTIVETLWPKQFLLTSPFHFVRRSEKSDYSQCLEIATSQEVALVQCP